MALQVPRGAYAYVLSAVLVIVGIITIPFLPRVLEHGTRRPVHAQRHAKVGLSTEDRRS